MTSDIDNVRQSLVSRFDALDREEDRILSVLCQPWGVDIPQLATDLSSVRAQRHALAWAIEEVDRLADELPWKSYYRDLVADYDTIYLDGSGSMLGTFEPLAELLLTTGKPVFQFGGSNERVALLLDASQQFIGGTSVIPLLDHSIRRGKCLVLTDELWPPLELRHYNGPRNITVVTLPYPTS